MSEQPKLTKRQYLTLGSLLLGMFFGAGNLIFPIHLGQLAGDAWLPAAVGFLLSAILLPLLAIMAISLTRASSMYDLARPVGHGFALFFLLATHASLGLLIASPRTATVSYTIGIAPFLGKGQQQIGLLIFSFLFFLTTFCLAWNESKITTYIGKLLNPLFLILLAAIFFWAFLIKGDIRAVSTTGNAKLISSNLINGFLQGYNTMDALAGLGFGVTIITALKLMGLHHAGGRAKAVAKVGSLAMGLEAVIYVLLIMLGAISLRFSKLTENGGTAFNQIMTHYTGLAGTALLEAMTLLACLTTAIGLVTSFSQDLGHRFPRLGYHFFLPVTAIGAFFIANFGLDQIIAYSTPILMLLYPLAIALILLGLLHPWIGKNTRIYKVTVGFTVIPALLDAVHALPAGLARLPFFAAIQHFATSFIPWYTIGMDFVPFIAVGFLGGLIAAKLSGVKLAPDLPDSDQD
ncbi:branched-chain amino acid transport system II carrier protein [Schleiferilactobacillus shenzhenensis]|nr:branched-chain amino acid transport system II carrier protein [Schleiferilactobacillus shenzhenensis]